VTKKPALPVSITALERRRRRQREV